MDTLSARQIQAAWEKGFARYTEKFPDAIRDVPRQFAREKFWQDCEGKENDARFPSQAPDHAYLLLCQEHLRFNDYAEEEGE